MIDLRFWRNKARFAFDFGTANLRVVSSDGGLVLEEPSICCFRRDPLDQSPVAVGSTAWPMFERTPNQLHMKRPLDRGVLTDMQAARALLDHARRRIVGNRKLSGPVLFGVPSDATLVERRALTNAAHEAGIYSVSLVDEPMAAALGAGLDVAEPRGSMLVECGAGTTEIVVITLGGISVRRTVRIGGTALDQAIADYLHLQHKFLVGGHTAERIKLELSDLSRSDADGTAPLTIRGRDLVTGLPGTLSLPPAAFDKVLRRHNRPIVKAVQEALAATSAELSCDIFEHGITLTGGSAHVPLLADMIADTTGLAATVANQNDLCVSLGLETMLLS